MNDWQPIVSAPQDGTEILAYEKRPETRYEVAYELIRVVAFANKEEYYSTEKNFRGERNVWCVADTWDGEYSEYATMHPTHWMPLPEPPKETI